MENLIIEKKEDTPFISMDVQTGVIEITGMSYPANTFEFYQPVLLWIEECFSMKEKIKLLFKFEIIYFNSSSSQFFSDLFDILEKESKNKKEIIIHWIYDEENSSALEAGEEFIEDFEALNFQLVQK